MPDPNHTHPPATRDSATQQRPVVDAMQHPTEPVVIDVYVDVILTDLGVTAGYERARHDLDACQQQLDGLDWAATPGTPGAPSREQREQRYHLAELQAALDWQQDLDWRQYGARLAANVTAAATELGVPAVVSVDLHNRPDVWPERGDGTDDLAWDLVVAAVDRTPLPGAGRSPLQRLGSHPIRSALDRPGPPSPPRTSTAQRCATPHSHPSSRRQR